MSATEMTLNNDVTVMASSHQSQNFIKQISSSKFFYSETIIRMEEECACVCQTMLIAATIITSSVLVVFAVHSFKTKVSKTMVKFWLHVFYSVCIFLITLD